MAHLLLPDGSHRLYYGHVQQLGSVREREVSDMQKKRWADFSAAQKAGIIVMGTIQIGLLAAGLWDLGHRKAEEVRGDRRLWAGLMFVNWIGPIAYFACGRKDSPLCRCCCSSKAEEPAVTEEAAKFGGPSIF
jgi:hypothetical protein